MWPLILTLISTYHGSPATTSVSGFKSYEACNAAAKAWRAQVATSVLSVEVFTLCARQD